MRGAYGAFKARLLLKCSKWPGRASGAPETNDPAHILHDRGGHGIGPGRAVCEHAVKSGLIIEDLAELRGYRRQMRHCHIGQRRLGTGLPRKRTELFADRPGDGGVHPGRR